MALVSNFMMLTRHLHSLFKKYIVSGRIRCPPEKELGELIPTFNAGAQIHRRALQSKFRSWAKRMTVENDTLVLASSKQEIIPQEICEAVIMNLHTDQHIKIEYLILKIQQKYTWSNKNFGMEREMVIGTIAKHCHKEECKRDVKLKMYKRSLRPYRPRNSLLVAQPTYFNDFSQSGNQKHYHAVGQNRKLEKHETAKLSPYKSRSKSLELNALQPIPSIHLQGVGVGHTFKPAEEPGNKENIKNSIVLKPQSVMTSNLGITFEKAEPNNRCLLSSSGLVEKGISSSSLDQTSTTSTCTESFLKNESSGHKKYNLRSRSCESPRNVREYKKLMNTVEDNPVLYPKILSSSKTKFLSVFGLAPKQIFSEETLSNFDFELKKQLLMNKPQNWFEDRNLREKNKMYNLRSRGQHKYCENDKCNLYKTLKNKKYLTIRLPRQGTTYVRNKSSSSASLKDIPSSFEVVNKEYASRSSDTKKQNEAVFSSTLQLHSQRLENIINNCKTNSSDATKKALKEYEVIDITSDSDEERVNKEENSVRNAEKKSLKVTATKEDHRSHEKPMLFSNRSVRGTLQNNEFKNRIPEGIRCCCPSLDAMKSKYNYFQPRSNFPSINKRYKQDQLLRQTFPNQCQYSNNILMHPTFRFSSQRNPRMPLTWNMCNRLKVESREKLNVRNCQPKKLPDVTSNVSGLSVDLSRKCNSIGSNSSVWKPVIPRSDKESSCSMTLKSTSLNKSSSDNSIKQICQERNPFRSSRFSIDNKLFSPTDAYNDLRDGFHKKNSSNNSYSNFLLPRSNVPHTSENNPSMTDSTSFRSNILNREAYTNETEPYKTTQFDSGLFSKHGVKPIFDINLTYSNRNLVMDTSNKYNETSLNSQLINRDTITNSRLNEHNHMNIASNMNLLSPHLFNNYPDVCINAPNSSVKNTLVRPNLEGKVYENNNVINASKNIIKQQTMRPYNIYSNTSQVKNGIKSSNKNKAFKLDTSNQDRSFVNKNTSSMNFSNEKTYTLGYDDNGKQSWKVTNVSNSELNSTHVKKYPNDNAGTLSSSSKGISTTQAVEENRKYLNHCYDTSLLTQEQLKELSKNHTIIILNKQPRKRSTIPVYRRILPRIKENFPQDMGNQVYPRILPSIKEDLPQGVGKLPDVVAEKNTTKFPMEANSSTYIENSTKSLEEINCTEDSSVVNSKVDTRDSTKRNIEDEMQELVSWIDGMKSSVNPSPKVLQESKKSLHDNLEVGIILIQNLRKSLINKE